MIFEKNLSGARPIEAPLGKRQDGLEGSQSTRIDYCHDKNSQKSTLGAREGGARENRRYRASILPKSRPNNSKFIKNKPLFTLGFVLPNRHLPNSTKCLRGYA